VGSKEREFWNFFQDNEELLHNYEQNQETASKLIYNAIKRVDKSLTFDFDCIQDNRRPFIITANGRKKAFPAVETLHKAAPKRLNKRWKIIKYRRRVVVTPSFQMTYNTTDGLYHFEAGGIATGSIQPRPAIGSTLILNDGRRIIVTKANKIYFKLFMQNNYEKIGLMLFIDGIDDDEVQPHEFGNRLQESSVMQHLKTVGYLWYVPQLSVIQS